MKSEIIKETGIESSNGIDTIWVAWPAVEAETPACFTLSYKELQNRLLWENTNVQFSHLFLFWLLYPNVSKTDTLSSAKYNFSLKIKLQPAIHFTFTKWQPLDDNLLLLPSHTGTGGNSRKEQTVQRQLCAAHTDPSLPLLSDTHTLWLQWESQRQNKVLQVYLLQHTRAGCIKYLCKPGHFYLDEIQSTNCRHSWPKTFISTLSAFMERPYCLKKLLS